jgi:hypothetical protein
MSTVKKHISFILAALMVLSVFAVAPITASAGGDETVISTIEITDLEEPEVGANPDTTCTVSQGLTVKKVEFLDDNGDAVKASKTFLSGYTYYVQLYLETQSGYKFNVVDDKLAVTSTVNGKEASVGGYYVSTLNGQENVIVTITFDKLIDSESLTPVSKVELTNFKVPYVGEHKHNVMPFSTSGVYVGSFRFATVGDDNISDNDVFEEGVQYKALFYIYCQEGFRFPLVDGKPDVAVTVNGQTAEVGKVMGYSADEALHVRLFFTPEKRKINEIRLTGLVKPMAGEKPVYNLTPSEGFTVKSFDWYLNNPDSTPVLLNPDDVFEEGKRYFNRIIVEANSGYAFTTDAKAFFNDETESFTAYETTNDPEKERRISVEYAPAKAPTEITSVDFTDLVEPVAGAHPATTVTAPDGVTVYGVSWFDGNDNQLTASDVFEVEKEYYADIYIQTKSGYKFYVSEDKTAVTATVNGKEAKVSGINGYSKFNYLCVSTSFVTENSTEPTQPDTTEPTEPGTTEPTQPVTTEPTQPVTTEPTQPVTTEPTQPGTAEPTQLVTTEPTQPGTTEPTQPQTEPFTEPATTEPVASKPSNDIGYFNLSGIKNKTYTGKAISQKITLVDTENNYTLVPDTDYIVTYKNNKNVGTATVIITAVGDYEGSIIKTFKITKADNPIKVKPVTKSVKLKTVKKKSVTVKGAVKVTKAQGKLACKITSAPKAVKKYLKISSKGVITVKKWAKAKKGSYKIKVKVTAKGTSNYKSKSVTKTIKLKVK